MANEAVLEPDNLVLDQPLEIAAPETGSPLSEREAASSIESLLNAVPEADRGTEKEKTPAPEEDPLGADDGEDVATDEIAEGKDGPTAGGQFVPDTGKIKMASGETITVAELKEYADTRAREMQRVFTQRTQEAAAKSQEVEQLSQRLSDERNYLIWFSQTYAPQPPQPPQVPVEQDPIAHLQYQEQLRNYQAFAASYQQFANAQKGETDRKAQQSTQATTERQRKEVQTLFEKLPFLKDQTKATSFFGELERSAAEHYGFAASDLATAFQQDHRYALVLRDAARYRKGQAAAPKVKEQLAQVPKMVRQPTARTAPEQRQAKAVTSTRERLRQSGNINDGAAAIEALISGT